MQEDTRDHPDFLADGLGQQKGVWACCVVRELGAVDPENCDLAWIFDAGASEGLISREELVKTVGSGRWPKRAVVAMDDRTNWTTVAKFLDTKAAGQN